MRQENVVHSYSLRLPGILEEPSLQEQVDCGSAEPGGCRAEGQGSAEARPMGPGQAAAVGSWLFFLPGQSPPPLSHRGPSSRKEAERMKKDI